MVNFTKRQRQGLTTSSAEFGFQGKGYSPSFEEIWRMAGPEFRSLTVHKAHYEISKKGTALRRDLQSQPLIDVLAQRNGLAGLALRRVCCSSLPAAGLPPLPLVGTHCAGKPVRAGNPEPSRFPISPETKMFMFSKCAATPMQG